MASSRLTAEMPNVGGVPDAGLCTGCGTCESVCPNGAIQLLRDDRKGVYSPVVADQLCVRCTLCLRVCPGIEVDLAQLTDLYLDGQCQDPLLGRFDRCYFGHAALEPIRWGSASGGLVTALLLHALEAGIIDGALVLCMSESDPLEVRPILATTASEIISASGSKYCPSPVNVGLRQILAREGRFALVGLPCHLHAARKLERIDRQFCGKIVLHLGLFSANNNTYLGTEYFLRQHGIRGQFVRRIEYRGEGWPGKICVTLADGTRKVMPRATTETIWHRRALFSSAFHYDFAIPRCLLCSDQTNELADIAFGDPWLARYIRSERVGKSLAIARTRAGRTLLEEAEEAGHLVMEDAPIGDVRRAQNYHFKSTVGARIRLWRLLGLATPDYGNRYLDFRAKDLLAAVNYLPSHVSHYRSLWPVLRFIAVSRYLTSVACRKAATLLSRCHLSI